MRRAPSRRSQRTANAGFRRQIRALITILKEYFSERCDVSLLQTKRSHQSKLTMRCNVIQV